MPPTMVLYHRTNATFLTLARPRRSMTSSVSMMCRCPDGRGLSSKAQGLPCSMQASMKRVLYNSKRMTWPATILCRYQAKLQTTTRSQFPWVEVGLNGPPHALPILLHNDALQSLRLARLWTDHSFNSAVARFQNWIENLGEYFKRVAHAWHSKHEAARCMRERRHHMLVV